MPGTEQWPEFYGFTIWGKGPTYVISVEKGSIADEAGLVPGDQLLELDNVDVSTYSVEEIKALARQRKKPGAPTVGVVSKIQTMDVPYNRRLGYGFSLTGARPILVDRVNPYGPSHQAGLRDGDVVLQINGYHVTSPDVVEAILGKAEKISLGILVTAKGDGSIISASAHQGRRSRDTKARELFHKLNVVLGADHDTKMHVVGLLKQYAEHRDVAHFAHNLNQLLSHSADNQPILQEIRGFVPEKHLPIYDSMLSTEQVSPVESIPKTPRHPDSARLRPHRRIITVDRSASSNFGFILRGNQPVFIESVEPNGVAAVAGLRDGDCIIKLNGMDVSGFSHNHLVQLLQNSGSKPTLEVCQLSDYYQNTTNGLQQHEPSFSSFDLVPQPSNNGHPNEQQSFKTKAEQVLTKEERLRLKDALQSYKTTKNIQKFTTEVSSIFNTPIKLTLWPYLLPKIPEEHCRYLMQHAPMPVSMVTAAAGTPRQRHSSTSGVGHFRSGGIDRAQSTPSLNTLPNNSNYRSTAPASVSSGPDRLLQPRLDHLTSFKHQLEYLLTSKERTKLKKALQQYSTHR